MTAQPMTAKTIAKSAWRCALASTFFIAPAVVSVSEADAQQWSPQRISPDSQARPLGGDRVNQVASHSGQNTVQSNTQDLGRAVTLRWKTPASPASTASPSAAAAFADTANRATVATPTDRSTEMRQPTRTNQPGVAHHASARKSSGNFANAAPSANPLRSSVRPAAYQQPDPFGGSTFPALPQEFPDPGLPLPNGLPDPLQEPELAPPPTSQLPANPFQTPPQDQLAPSQDDSPRDRTDNAFGDEAVEDLPLSDADDEELPDLRRRSEGDLRYNCNDLRERLRSLSITDINLDVSPAYGVGLRSNDTDAAEKRRQEFAESAQRRQWRDYRGRDLVFGRLLDLRDDRVILDVDGAQRSIPLRDLSDMDVAYVGEAWNIPTQCGTGFEPYEARNFIASTVQWTAPGLCHKPLYFEQVQLERYGHELGPVLQPLVSSAHFFGSIGVLPYKAGIHPPNECQYALGYYRPGDCAPYMIQPFPWSLRGGLTQAAAVTGAAALIP